MSGHDGRWGYIYHTAVAEACRRTGIGTQLVVSALAALRREGIRKVALVGFDTNGVGNAFWEKQVFASREDLVYRNKEI